MKKKPSFYIISVYVILFIISNSYCQRNTYNNDSKSLKNSTFNYNNLKEKKLNIAIIGSGIGGLSTAHFLKKNKLLKINKIDIYERHSRTGGRVYSASIFNRTENLGASFFIKKNKLIYSLVEELKLNVFSTASNSDTSFGLFENRTIFFSLGNSKLINILKMFWRYGISIIREKFLMKNNLEKFTKIYEALQSRIIFSDVRQLINYIGLEDLVSQSIKEYLLEKNIDGKYIDEFANLLLKIIYNQQNDLNAFAGFITLVGGSYETLKIEGGNYELIKKLEESLLQMKKSYQNTYLIDNDIGNIIYDNDASINILKDTNVLKIIKKFYSEKNKEYKDYGDNYYEFENNKSRMFEFYTIEFQKRVLSYEKLRNETNNYTKFDKNDNINDLNKDDIEYEINSENYDIVILASPLENSKIVFPKEVDLNNTDLLPQKNYYYFIKGKLRNDLFQDYISNKLPGMLISYNKSLSDNILYIKQLNDNSYKDEFKINSDEPLTNKDLEKYFESNFTIAYVNHWSMAYPKLNPRKIESLPSFQLSDNLFYLNAIESIGSCMELSIISAKNIVNLIETKYYPFRDNTNFKTGEL